MKNIYKKIISTLVISAALSTSAVAIEKLHFVIPGGAGGGWDGTARGTGEALLKSGLLEQASFENMSGGGGGKALAWLIRTQPENTVMVQSTPIVLRSIGRRASYVSTDAKSGVFSYKDVTPIAGIIGDFGAIVVLADSPYQTFADLVAAYNADPKSVKMAGGSTRGSMDHLIGALAFQAAGANPNDVVYIPYDGGGKAMAGLLSGETQVLSTGLSEAVGLGGQVRILGITADERSADFPSIPTLKEQGVDAYFVNWRGFFGAPGMDAMDRYELGKMLTELQTTPEWEVVRKRNGWVNILNTGDDFIAFLEKQTEEMTVLMKQLGVIK
jgi:putative tricarboxylic transport membrane protein